MKPFYAEILKSIMDSAGPSVVGSPHGILLVTRPYQTRIRARQLSQIMVQETDLGFNRTNVIPGGLPKVPSDSGFGIPAPHDSHPHGSKLRKASRTGIVSGKAI